MTTDKVYNDSMELTTEEGKTMAKTMSNESLRKRGSHAMSDFFTRSIYIDESRRRALRNKIIFYLIIAAGLYVAYQLV